MSDMTTSDPSANVRNGYFRASCQFWICNAAGWSAFGFLRAVIDSFDGGFSNEELKSGLLIVLLGICSGLGVHLLHKKRCWERKHPLQLVPVGGWIAVVFGVVVVLIDRFDLAVEINQICARETPRPPYLCGALSDLFLKSMGGMLIWCILYFLIKADRRTDQVQRPGAASIGIALLTLILLNHLGIFLSVIAYVHWGSTDYLFSRAYAVDAVMNLIPLFSAAYILFISSDKALFGSRILSLVPLLMVMAFCCTSLNVQVAGAIARIRFVGDHADLYHILLGSAYGGFSGAGQLAGVMEGGVINSLCMTLFFLACRSTSRRGAESHGGENESLRSTAPVWFYSLLFWCAFGFLVYGSDLMELSFLGSSVTWVSTISCIGVGVFLGLILRLHVVHFITRSSSGLYLTTTMTIASVFAGLLLTYAIWLINYIYILIVLDGYEMQRYANFVNNRNYVASSLLTSAVLCGLWSFICFMIESLARHRDSAIRQIQMERSMKDLQLNALAGKVDPHFIFNALNNIRALVDEDREKARAAIAALSDILRGPISSSSQDKTTVAEEMLLVRHYVSLSKIQYEERLRYREEIGEEAYFARIPSMMLQILVENAIKHGISQSVGGGDLIVAVQKVEQNLVCEVKNEGAINMESKAKGFGIGTKAINQRLSLLYGSHARFQLYEAAGRVIAELILPFEHSPL